MAGKHGCAQVRSPFSAIEPLSQICGKSSL
jgi:hypothetical protein